VEAEGLTQVREEDRLRGWVDEARSAHPEEAARLDAGELKLVGFFMGEVMRLSGGRADPQRAAAMLRERRAGE
jgi:aspartyl-tRNA(Asn)/glutamyl-tRNA(Gln) amidotransferase subunit B